MEPTLSHCTTLRADIRFVIGSLLAAGVVVAFVLSLHFC